MEKVRHWFQTKLRNPWRRLHTAEKLLALIVGVLGGVFPIPALTTIATLALASLLALNAPQTGVATAINLALTPVAIGMIPVFAHLAAFFSGADTTTFSAEFLMAAAAESLTHLLAVAASVLIHATVAWVVITAVVFAGVKVLLPRLQHAGLPM